MGNQQELLGTWTRYAFPLGVTGAIMCAAIAVSTFLPGAPFVPEGVVFLLFFGVFPLHVGSVFALRHLGGDERNPIKIVFRRLPMGMRAIVLTTCALFWLMALSGIVGRTGETKLRDGHYYASDKGELTEISKDGYDERRAGTSRIFSAGPGCFYVLGAAIAYLARKGSLADESPAIAH